MKRILSRVMALCLAAVLCGCSASPAPEVNAPAAEGESSTYYLANTVDESTSIPYAMESPPIDNLAVSDTAIPAEPVNIVIPGAEAEDSAAASVPASVRSEEVKAVWISYLEMETLLKGKTESQFRANIGGVFDNVAEFGLNTVVVQVRPFADALYKSDYFPWSYTITGTEGKDPGFDPLEVMLTEAKKRGLRFDAWINPYRVRMTGNSNALSASNQAKKWLDAGDGAVIQYGGFISYNPSSAKAREHIINGVREIIRNYDVDAIHIDDYFYPTTDAAFDKDYYNSYVQGGGTLSQADWRRAQVETLVKDLYSAIKEENPNVLFGISPQGNIDTNYNGQYFDVRKIASQAGYCDYICPQVYYGFENSSQPYAQVVGTWNEITKDSPVELYIGIAVYKLGVQDNWAGSGINEWMNTTTQLKKMVEEARGNDSCTGFILYRYDSLFSPASGVSAQVNRELENLKKIL